MNLTPLPASQMKVEFCLRAGMWTKQEVEKRQTLTQWQRAKELSTEYRVIYLSYVVDNASRDEGFIIKVWKPSRR
jgi:hypothetical protein